MHQPVAVRSHQRLHPSHENIHAVHASLGRGVTSGLSGLSICSASAAASQLITQL